MHERTARAIEAIDRANAADPTGKALRHGLRMSEVLERLCPEASEPLRLAVRAAHIERWTIPRERYPRDRAGYLRWRSALASMHAARATQILREVGLDEATVARVAELVQKKRLATDPEAQMLEDCACLVFLEDDLERFVTEHPEEKVVAILRKTWAKMGERGRREALAIAPALPERARALLERALDA